MNREALRHSIFDNHHQQQQYTLLAQSRCEMIPSQEDLLDIHHLQQPSRKTRMIADMTLKKGRDGILGTLALSVFLCGWGLLRGLQRVQVHHMTHYQSVPSFPSLFSNGSREAAVAKESAKAAAFFSPPVHDVKPFRFFVYSNLSEDFLPYKISQCVHDKIGNNASCDWGLHTCTMENVTQAQKSYVRYRHNYNADVVQADLFLRYPINASETATPFATRTDSPHDADIFVVPYPHDSHCKCVSSRPAPGCKDRDGRMEPQLRRLIQQHLIHFNRSTHHRHLFLTGSIHLMSHAIIQNMTLRTSKGDARHCLDHNTPPCGMIIAPTHKALHDYQPTVLQNENHRPLAWWTSRPRTHSLVGFFGRQDSDVTIRNEVLDQVEELFPTTIGGLPTMVQDSFGDSRTLSNERDILQAYQNATFCLILPGDAPIGNRVYDTIMSGCVPVMLKYTDKNGEVAWFKFRKRLVPNHVVYPFAKGIFSDDVGIDYGSMVVEVDMDKCGLKCIAPILEQVMANKTELKRLQSNLRRHAALLSYGLEENAYRTFDAFGLLLWQLGHYAHRVNQSEGAGKSGS
jgi:hypothetical protein